MKSMNNDGVEDIADKTEKTKLSEDNTHEKRATQKPTIKSEDRRGICLSLRYKVLSRDNFRCVRCGRSPAINPGVELHVDHKQPFSKQGKTIMENLETKCKECNLGKSNRHSE